MLQLAVVAMFLKFAPGHTAVTPFALHQPERTQLFVVFEVLLQHLLATDLATPLRLLQQLQVLLPTARFVLRQTRLRDRPLAELTADCLYR